VAVHVDVEEEQGRNFYIAWVQSTTGKKLTVHWFSPHTHLLLGGKWTLDYVPAPTGKRRLVAQEEIKRTDVIPVPVCWRKPGFGGKSGGYLTSRCIQELVEWVADEDFRNLQEQAAAPARKKPSKKKPSK
jgi:hypothetical protein